MTFHVYAGGGTHPEHMRITSAGKGGIGTTSPERPMHFEHTGG